jgi:catalase
MASKRATAAAPRKNPGQSRKNTPAAKRELHYNEKQGAGGETHQIASNDVETLTTQQGIPVADDQNTLRYGAREPPE